jgi:hypothetical protein
MKTFAIVYGFAEGDYHARKFIAACSTAGLERTSPSNADIIFAHSGGCFVVPSNPHNTTILVGVSPWKDISTFACLAKKIRTDRPTAAELFWHACYIFAKPLHAYRMLVNKTLIGSTNVIVICNKNDPYFPKEKAKLLESQGYKVTSFLGGHDDIWHNPAKYIELVV